MKTLKNALVAALLAVVPAAAFAAVPPTISFTARLADAGAPVTGAHNIVFRLLDDIDTELWIESKSVTVEEGVLAAALGDSAPLDPGLFNGAPLFLEVSVDGNVMSPRMLIQSVPYAIRAATADSALSALQADDVVCVSPPCVQDGEIESVDGAKVSGAVSAATTASNATNLSCSGTCVQDAEIQSVSGTKITGWQNLATTASPTFASLTLTGSLNAGLEIISSASSNPISGGGAACPNYGNGACYFGQATATCSVGKRLLGGHCFVGGTIVAANIMGTSPSNTSVTCYANSASTSNSLVAHAICARIAP